MPRVGVVGVKRSSCILLFFVVLFSIVSDSSIACVVCFAVK